MSQVRSAIFLDLPPAVPQVTFLAGFVSQYPGSLAFELLDPVLCKLPPG